MSDPKGCLPPALVMEMNAFGPCASGRKSWTAEKFGHQRLTMFFPDAPSLPATHLTSCLLRSAGRSRVVCLVELQSRSRYELVFEHGCARQLNIDSLNRVACGGGGAAIEEQSHCTWEGHYTRMSTETSARIRDFQALLPCNQCI